MLTSNGRHTILPMEGSDNDQAPQQTYACIKTTRRADTAGIARYRWKVLVDRCDGCLGCGGEFVQESRCTREIRKTTDVIVAVVWQSGSRRPHSRGAPTGVAVHGKGPTSWMHATLLPGVYHIVACTPLSHILARPLVLKRANIAISNWYVTSLFAGERPV
jgi:hypothetical protein